MPALETTWAYLTLTIRASLDEQSLTVKQGIRTFKASIAELRHLYFESTGGGQYELLTLVGEPSPGKKKVLRFYANAGQPSIRQFMGAILQVRPDIDRRNLSPAEARKVMGVKDVDTRVMLGLIGFIMAGLFTLALPSLIHGLDHGEQRISAKKLAKNPELESRNLVITDADLDWGRVVHTVTVTKRNGVETGRSNNTYIPIVAEDGPDGGTVHVVLKTGDLDSKTYESLGRNGKIRGMARTALWEGLSGKARDIIEQKLHGKLAKDAILIEFGKTPEDEMLLFGLIFGLGSVVTGGILGAVLWNQKRKAKPST